MQVSEFWLDIGSGIDAEHWSATAAPAGVRRVALDPLFTSGMVTSGRLSALHDRFRDHTVKLFEKHGMTNVAYFTPIEGPVADNTLVYFLWHKSKAAAAASFEEFRADPDWVKARTASEEKGKILAKPPESSFLKLTDYSTPMPAAQEDRVYEMRTYVANDGKFVGLARDYE